MDRFSRADAEAILTPCKAIRGHINFKDDGIWPNLESWTEDQKNQLLREEFYELTWRPARELQGLANAPVIKETASMPFPFNANQLAAFMLNGVGAFVADFYGDMDKGPDPVSLKVIDRDSRGCMALEQAYALRREAERLVGAYPLALDVEADRARKEYNEANMRANIREKVFEKSLSNEPGSEESKLRRARAVASTVKLELAMEAKAAEAETAQKAWLKAMVLHLLQLAHVQGPATPANGTGKKWNSEKLAKLKAYREGHTMLETASKFGISEQRIRQLLPSKKPKAKLFSGLIHRAE